MGGSRYYFTRNKQKIGPFSSRQLKQLAEVGMLTPDDYIWKEGASKWLRGAEVHGLFPGAAEEKPAPAAEAPTPAAAPAPEPAPPPQEEFMPVVAAEDSLPPQPAPVQEAPDDEPVSLPPEAVLPMEEEAPVTLQPAPLDVQMAPAPSAAEPRFHYRIGGQQAGPIPLTRLKELAAAGELRPDHHVWQVGTKDWVAALRIDGLFPGQLFFGTSADFQYQFLFPTGGTVAVEFTRNTALLHTVKIQIRDAADENINLLFFVAVGGNKAMAAAIAPDKAVDNFLEGFREQMAGSMHQGSQQAFQSTIAGQRAKGYTLTAEMKGIPYTVQAYAAAVEHVTALVSCSGTPSTVPARQALADLVRTSLTISKKLPVPAMSRAASGTDPQFHYRIDGRQMGPVSLDQLKALAARQLKPGDYVWQVGTRDWVPAARIDGVFRGLPFFGAARGYQYRFLYPVDGFLSGVTALGDSGTSWVVDIEKDSLTVRLFLYPAVQGTETWTPESAVDTMIGSLKKTFAEKTNLRSLTFQPMTGMIAGQKAVGQTWKGPIAGTAWTGETYAASVGEWTVALHWMALQKNAASVQQVTSLVGSSLTIQEREK